MASLEELLKGRFEDATDAEVHWALRVADDNVVRAAAEQRSVVRGKVIGWLVGDLECRSRFRSNSICIQGVEVEGRLRLDDVDADFVIEFDDCLFPEPLSVQRAKLRELRMRACILEKGLLAGGIRVEGDFTLFGISSNDTIVLDDARIDGTFVLSADNQWPSRLTHGYRSGVPGSDLDAEPDIALSMARTRVEGQCVVGATIIGQFRLKHCRIGADLILEGAHVSNPGQLALDLGGAAIGGSCRLTPRFKADGLVAARYAQIGSLLDASGAQLDDPQMVDSDGKAEPTSLDARGARIRGTCLLDDDFCAAGMVSLRSAHIEGDLLCDRGVFRGLPLALDANQAHIAGTFSMTGVSFSGDVSFSLGQCARLYLRRCAYGQPAAADLNLKYANCRVLHDEPSSWAGFKGYALEGFQYVAVWGDRADARDWAGWLSESKGQISLDAYEHLAKVLGAVGDTGSRRKVLIAKEELRSTRLEGWRRELHKAWWFLAGYGHNPWHAVGSLGVLWLLGWGAVAAAPDGTFFRAKERAYVERAIADAQRGKSTLRPAYPTLEPWVYSLDVLVPFVDLHQEDYWRPDTRASWGLAVQRYLAVHTLLGWIFATVGLAAMTGLVKRE